MKIAVNTRFLLPGQLEGFGWYTHELVRRMVLAHPEDRFLFLFDRPFDARYVYAANVEPVVVFPPARHPVLFYAWFEGRIPGILKQWGADCFFSPDSMCSLRSRVPVVMTVHDLAPLHFPENLPFTTRKYLQWMLPRQIRRANRILTVSQFVKTDITQLCKAEPGKIEVVYNGCREGFLPLQTIEKEQVKKQFSHGRDYFFYTGAIHPRKNIHRLIKAYDRFREKNSPPVNLLLAGRFAWQTGVVKEAYDASPFKQDIHFLGYVPEHDLYRLTASARALAYVSLSEGFGLPMLEAMYTDTPVLAARATCLPEIAGDAALLVDPLSVEDIAAGLVQLDTDAGLRDRLVAAGRERRSAFSWDAAADALYKALTSVAKNP